eukprot:g5568.t1
MEITDDIGTWYWNCNEHTNAAAAAEITTTWTCATTIMHGPKHGEYDRGLGLFTLAVPVGSNMWIYPNGQKTFAGALCEGPLRVGPTSFKLDPRPDLAGVSYNFGTGGGNLRTLTAYCNDVAANTQLMEALHFEKPMSPAKKIRWAEIEVYAYPSSSAIPSTFTNEWKIYLGGLLRISRIKFYLPNKVGWMQGMRLGLDDGSGVYEEGSFNPYDGSPAYENVYSNALPGVEDLWKWSADDVRTYERDFSDKGPCLVEARYIGL